jgi:hypothetical protein
VTTANSRRFNGSHCLIFHLASTSYLPCNKSAASQRFHPMEIVFKSPTQSERFLHDALAENPSETLSALLCAVCDTIYTTSFLPKKLLLSSLEALVTQESRFRMALTNIEFNWSFTPKELYILQDASDGLYAEDDIEGAFYKHGGYDGIIALILFFRKSGKVQKQWAAIAKEFRGWLAKRVTEMLSCDIVEWIPQFLSTQSTYCILQITPCH